MQKSSLINTVWRAFQHTSSSMKSAYNMAQVTVYKTVERYRYMTLYILYYLLYKCTFYYCMPVYCVPLLHYLLKKKFYHLNITISVEILGKVIKFAVLGVK